MSVKSKNKQKQYRWHQLHRSNQARCSKFVTLNELCRNLHDSCDILSLNTTKKRIKHQSKLINDAVNFTDNLYKLSKKDCSYINYPSDNYSLSRIGLECGVVKSKHHQNILDILEKTNVNKMYDIAAGSGIMVATFNKINNERRNKLECEFRGFDTGMWGFVEQYFKIEQGDALKDDIYEDVDENTVVIMSWVDGSSKDLDLSYHILDKCEERGVKYFITCDIEDPLQEIGILYSTYEYLENTYELLYDGVSKIKSPQWSFGRRICLWYKSEKS
jgi:hypothetical protein